MHNATHGTRDLARRSRGVSSFAVAFVMLVVATSIPGCFGPTEIRLAVTTTANCDAGIETEIRAGKSTPPDFASSPAATTSACGAVEPRIGTLAIVPSGSRDDQFEVEVVAGVGVSAASCRTSSARCIVARRRVSFRPHQSLTLPILLSDRCIGVPCDVDQTCDLGRCTSFADCNESGCPHERAVDAGTDAADAPSATSAGLLGLTISAGTLSPAFSPATPSYEVVPSVASLGVPFTVTPTVASGASVTINGAAVASGTASPVIALGLMVPTPVDVTVTPAVGAPMHYAIVVPPVQEAYAKASNTRASTQFGYSVSLYGDTLAVGSPDESSNATGINGNQADTSAPNAGAVYVFTRSGAAWSQQAYIKASNALRGALFGISVALSGDTLAVGSSGESGNAGAAYVFTRSGATWSQQAYVKASNASTQPNSAFGISVALSGDTLAVGAQSEGSNATGVNSLASGSAAVAGAAYVFTRSGATWSQQAYIKASNTRALAQFGASIALSGDTLAVGSPLETSNATGIDGNGAAGSANYMGAAYVFTRSGTTWSQQAYVKASNTNTLVPAEFGASVALSGDTLAVGSPYEKSNATGINGDQANTTAPSAGAVYVFTRSGTTWSQQAYVKASNTRPSANFGSSVALLGDMLAVGSSGVGSSGESSNAVGINGNQADTSASGAGAVYVFTRSGTTWAQQAYVKASNTQPNASFGASVALSSDTLAAGAIFESSRATGINGNQTDTSASSAGAVYILR